MDNQVPQPPVNQFPPKNPGQGLGIAAMVLGILSLVIPFFGTATAIVGLILGVVAKKKSSEAGMPCGMAIAGIVCSIVSLALSILCIFTCWIPAFCASAGFFDALSSGII